MKNPLAGLMDKDPAKKAALIALPIFFILFDLIFILKPQLSRLSGAIKKVSSAAAELERANDSISKADSYKKTVESYEEKINRHEKMLPAEKEIPALLENLSVMAKRSNIKIIGIVPAAEQKSEGAGRDKGVYQEIPIMISARSGYHELGSFINELENSYRFIKVADIDIRANTKTPAKHDVELVALTYVLLTGK